MINVLCVVIIVKKCIMSSPDSLVFSYLVLHRNKIPLVLTTKVAHLCSLLFQQQDGVNSVIQCGPATGTRATCGPPTRFQWPAEAFRENWNLLKSVWGYICLTELLALDKVHLYNSNTFSVYHFVLFIYFMIKLERPATRAPVWIISVFFRCPGVRCLEEYIWRSERSTAK